MTKQWEPLTDLQWTAISAFFDLQRKRKHELRTVMDAIFWLLRTGCQWRNLSCSDIGCGFATFDWMDF